VLLALDLPQFVQLAVKAMPQGALRAKLLEKGLSPHKQVLADFLSAKQSSPRPLYLVFGLQTITS
jgi:hypothetical protein